MNKVTVIFLVIGVLFIFGFFYVHFSIKKENFEQAEAKEPVIKPKHSESLLDLRPKLIYKLQELVKKGSDGLYNLSIHEINPDILQSSLDLGKASLIPDTAVLRQLELIKKAPDDVFKVYIDSLHIDGISIRDLLSANTIDLNTIYINSPLIEVFHSSRPYNKRNKSDSALIYKRLIGEMKHISVKKIIVRQGVLVDHNILSKATTRFAGMHITLSDLLIYSTTQCDKTR